MTQKMKRKVKNGKAQVVLAHSDSDDLTYLNVAVPNVVPLYANFDLARPVGKAFLFPRPGMVYASIELNQPVSGFGRILRIVLAVDGGTRQAKDGVNYLSGGQVSAASIVKEEFWKSIEEDQL